MQILKWPPKKPSNGWNDCQPIYLDAIIDNILNSVRRDSREQPRLRLMP